MNNNIPPEIIAKFQAKYDWLKREQFTCIGEPDAEGIHQIADGVWTCHYGNTANHDWCGCTIVFRPGDKEPREVHGKICERWLQEGGVFGWLGYPVSDEEVFEDEGDPLDRISHFENGDIICTSKTVSTRIVNIKDRARWYKAKHDQLLDLLRRAVEAPAPERHNEALRAVEDKCKEDQFDVVLLGVFQYGKSTTLDTLCGGREISPQGGGTTPTSAVPVSVQSLGENEPEEWGEIRFKTKRQLAGELFDTFESDICEPDSSHPLVAYLAKEDTTPDESDEKARRKSIRSRFCDGFDFDKPDHLSAARSALEDAWTFWEEHKALFPSRKLQLMEVETLIVRFYGSDEYWEMLSSTRCSVGDARNFVRFPADWSKNNTEGFSYNVSFKLSRFAFVDKVVLHLRSSFLETLGCRVTDCPGLDASAYDKEVTRRALLNADGVLFIHRSDRTIGASTGEELLELVGDTGRKDKTVFAANLWGISRGRALLPYADEDGYTSPSIFEDIEKNIRKGGYDFPVVWCHALLAHLAALGERRLKTGEPFSPLERRRLAAKADIRDADDKIFDDGRSDESLWLAAVAETNRSFKVQELKGLTALNESAVATVRQASNFDDLLRTASNVVLREKVGSILVDNGSKKAFKTLKSHEKELQLKKAAAEQNEKQCADEVAAASRDLDEYEKESMAAVNNSRLVKAEKETVASLSRSLVDDILSSGFYDGLSRRVAKTVRKLNKALEGLSEKGFRRKMREEVGPLIADYFQDKAVGKLEKWKETPSGRWRLFLDDVKDLADQIQELGSKRFGGKRIFEGEPIPEMPTNIDDSEIAGKISDSLSELYRVAEDLREGPLRQALNIVKWPFRKISSLFGIETTEAEILAEYAGSIRPVIENSFQNRETCQILENGVRPIFAAILPLFLDSLDKSRIAYRENIEARCNELTELHRSSDEELHRIAEENGKLCDECIAPLRAEVEAFEKSVLTAAP